MSDTDRNAPQNAEWSLSTFLDSLAAEIDRAQDTVALKSVSREITVKVTEASLDLAVAVRVDSVTRVYFRTVEPGVAPTTVLRLRLAETSREGGADSVSTSQADGLELSFLPGITATEVVALERLSILTLGDFRRFSESSALVADLARRSGIADSRLRRWLSLPFLLHVQPEAVSTGDGAVIVGGNLGDVREEADTVYFQASAAVILHWSESRIVVRVPEPLVAGPVYAVLDGSPTNVVTWTPTTVASKIEVKSVAPSQARQGDTISVILTGLGFSSSIRMTADLGPGVTVESINVMSATQATLAIVVAGDAPTGPHDVVVSRSNGDGPSILTEGFIVLTQAPTVLSVEPPRVAAGSTQRVSIHGSGFIAGLAVSFGEGIRTTIDSVTDSRVTVTVSVPPKAPPGARDVRVVNPKGQAAVLQRALEVIGSSNPTSSGIRRRTRRG